MHLIICLVKKNVYFHNPKLDVILVIARQKEVSYRCFWAFFIESIRQEYLSRTDEWIVLMQTVYACITTLVQSEETEVNIWEVWILTRILAEVIYSAHFGYEQRTMAVIYVGMLFSSGDTNSMNCCNALVWQSIRKKGWWSGIVKKQMNVNEMLYNHGQEISELYKKWIGFLNLFVVAQIDTEFLVVVILVYFQQG